MARLKNQRRPRRREEKWTKMILVNMDNDAWRALPSIAQALYPWLKLEWNGPDANNNGEIRFSVRQAAQAMGVIPDTAARGFHELQAKGFIVLTEHARLGSSGEAKSPSYELTELALPGSKGRPRKLFDDWRPGHDFPVHKATPNNPAGRNGKKKPCHENHDGTVINIMTKRQTLS